MGAEHIIAVRLKFDDSEFKGIERDEKLTKELQSTLGALGNEAAAAATKVDKLGKTSNDVVHRMGMTWKQFVGENMSAMMKIEGSHGAAMKRIGAEWQKYKAAAGDAHTHAVKGAEDVVQAEKKVAQAAANTTRAQTQSLAKLEGSLSSATGLVKAFFAAWAVRQAFDGAKAMVMQGVEYNATLQTSRLGIAALVSGLGEIRDRNNNILSGQERWNAALTISEDIQRRLKTAALQTTATYEDLLRVMQEGMGPMLTAGIADPGKQVDFVQRVAQAGGALNIRGDRLGQEVRSLLRGELGPDNQIANAILGDVPQEKLEQLRKTGELFDFLMEKMAAFSKAGEDAQRTFTGAMSNLRDVLTQALGAGTTETTDVFTQAILDLTASIVTFDAAGNAVFNPQFIETVELIGSGFSSAVRGLTDFALALPEIATQTEAVYIWLGRLKDLLAEYGQVNWGTAVAGPAGQFAVANYRANAAINTNPNLYDVDAIARQLGTDKAARQQYKDDPTGPFAPWQLYSEPAGPYLTPAQRFSLSAKPRSQGGPTSDAVGKMKADLESYDRWFDELAGKIDAGDDPIARKLAKIASDRDAAVAKVEAARKKFGASSRDWSAQIKAIRDDAAKEIDALVNEPLPMKSPSWAWGKMLEPGDGGTGKKLADLAREQQEAAEEERLGAIEDGIERELALRLAANDEWFEDMKKKHGDEKKVVEALLKWKAEKNAKAEQEAQRQRDLASTQTVAWMTNLQGRIDQTMRPVSVAISDALLAGVNIAQKGLDDLFAGLADGQLDLGKTLKGVSQDLSREWSKVFSDIVSNALTGKKSIAAAWKELFPKDMSPGQAFGAGAGIGGMIGGLFSKPGNYASEGGAIGGGIGAAIGAYFGGPAGAKVGVMIGSVIGTAIGAGITKGTDHIKLVVKGINLDMLRSTQGQLNPRTNGSSWVFGADGSIDMDEKGINGANNRDLMIQIRRRVKDVLKGWDSILEIFPEEVRAKLAGMEPGALNLTGEVKDGDIRDTDAFDSLSDVLGNQLGKAAFDSYSPILKKAFETMGLGSGKVAELFAYWGTLQGEELQEAVKGYISTFVTFMDNSKKLSGSPIYEVTKRENATPLTQLGDMNSQMAMITASLPKLVDVDDQLAAMERLNQLSGQFYEQMVNALMRVNQIAEATHQSLDRQREQIRLAGMNDQEKINFFYDRMAQLRTQLLAEEDPEKIAKIVQQIQDYAGQAFSLAGDNPENREKLEAILGDIDNISREGFETAREQIQAQQQKAAETLQAAGDKLLAAGEAWNTPPRTPIDPPGTKPPADGAPGRILDPGENSAGVHSTRLDELLVRLAEVRGASAIAGTEGAAESFQQLVESLREEKSIASERQGGLDELMRLMGEVAASVASASSRKLKIEGDGVEFLEELGLRIIEARDQAVEQTLGVIRNFPEATLKVTD